MVIEALSRKPEKQTHPKVAASGTLTCGPSHHSGVPKLLGQVAKAFDCGVRDHKTTGWSPTSCHQVSPQPETLITQCRIRTSYPSWDEIWECD